MKKITLTVFAVFSLCSLNAQWSTNGENVVTTGNVGIGTTSPNVDLDIRRNSSGGALRIFGNNVDLDFYMGHINNSYGYFWRYRGTQSGNNNDMEFWSDNQTSSTKRLVYRVKQSGNISFLQRVGIGIESTGSHMLAVDGSIGAREVVVESGEWSDFVFYDDYQLPTLEEVETHINEKGHLKDIPSAKTIEEEGIPLGKMDAKLLQKIEELTLYVLDINKDNKKQQKEIEALKEENQKLRLLLDTKNAKK